MNTKRIVIVGAGPTGLGAAYRLKELGHDNFVVIDGLSHVGGLARSFVDEHGSEVKYPLSMKQMLLRVSVRIIKNFYRKRIRFIYS